MDDYPFLELLWTILIIYVLFAYIMILFSVVADLFRDHPTSGWAKAGWIILFIFLPLIGVLIYLIARGPGMAERQVARQEQSQSEFDDYVRDVAGRRATRPRRSPRRRSCSTPVPSIRTSSRRSRRRRSPSI